MHTFKHSIFIASICSHPFSWKMACCNFIHWTCIVFYVLLSENIVVEVTFLKFCDRLVLGKFLSILLQLHCLLRIFITYYCRKPSFIPFPYRKSDFQNFPSVSTMLMEKRCISSLWGVVLFSLSLSLIIFHF